MSILNYLIEEKPKMVIFCLEQKIILPKQEIDAIKLALSDALAKPEVVKKLDDIQLAKLMTGFSATEKSKSKILNYCYEVAGQRLRVTKDIFTLYNEHLEAIQEEDNEWGGVNNLLKIFKIKKAVISAIDLPNKSDKIEDVFKASLVCELLGNKHVIFSHPGRFTGKDRENIALSKLGYRKTNPYHNCLVRVSMNQDIPLSDFVLVTDNEKAESTAKALGIRTLMV